jgi:pantoate--beta-alanine ligase
MLIIKKIDELKDVLFRIKSNNKSTGFIPTMGALHKGHLSLIERARKENEVVVCSIFVNPTQFNNPSDFANYPRTLADDVALLEKHVDIVFAPDAEEVYPKPLQEIYQFGVLETVMEGAARPGHFNGVAIIVKKLLDWIDPDKAYFGEKDYQQLLIIKQLVKEYRLSTEIVPCPIVREENGLAMSSRNRLLSENERNVVANVYRILEKSKSLITKPVPQVKDFVISQIAALPDIHLDYFEISEDQTLQPVKNFEEAKGIMGFVAVFLRDIRLIDNIRYK